jgi:hypothetical protein
LQDITGHLFTGLYWTLIYKTLQDFTGPYRTLNHFIGLFMTLNHCIGHCMTFQDFITGLYRTFLKIPHKRTLTKTKIKLLKFRPTNGNATKDSGESDDFNVSIQTNCGWGRNYGIMSNFPSHQDKKIDIFVQ